MISRLGPNRRTCSGGSQGCVDRRARALEWLGFFMGKPQALRRFPGPWCTPGQAPGPAWEHHRTPRQPVVGHIKKVCPSGRLTAPIGLLRRAWLQPRQKARLQNRFQSNNNRFKLLLPQPSLLQLRLAILTIEGSKESASETRCYYLRYKLS
jgi:hypothetical protein